MKPITDTMRHLYVANNSLLDEAAEKMADLVKAVDATGKPGSITITVKLRKATAGSLAVTSNVTVKRPAEPAVETLLFPTVEGALLTEDPNQRKLDLKPVAVESRELKSVNNS